MKLLKNLLQEVDFDMYPHIIKNETLTFKIKVQSYSANALKS